MSNNSIQMILLLFKIVAITGLSLVIGKYTCWQVGFSVMLIALVSTFTIRLKDSE